MIEGGGNKGSNAILNAFSTIWGRILSNIEQLS
jgi:hypothetical protein